MKTHLTISGPEDVNEGLLQKLKALVAELGEGKTWDLMLSPSKGKAKARKTYASWESKEEYERSVLDGDAEIERGEGVKFKSIDELKAYLTDKTGVKL